MIYSKQFLKEVKEIKEGFKLAANNSQRKELLKLAVNACLWGYRRGFRDGLEK